MFGLSPDGRMLYVSNEEDSALTAFDLVARRKAFEVPVGGEPEGVQASADGKLVYVASEVASVVHVIDVASRKVLKNVPVRKRPRRFLLMPRGELWVTNELDGSVSILRTSDHTVQGHDRLPAAGRAPGGRDAGRHGLAPDGRTAGRRLYVANGLSDDLTIVDTGALKALKTIRVGRVPHSVVVDD